MHRKTAGQTDGRERNHHLVCVPDVRDSCWMLIYTRLLLLLQLHAGFLSSSFYLIFTSLRQDISVSQWSNYVTATSEDCHANLRVGVCGFASCLDVALKHN